MAIPVPCHKSKLQSGGGVKGELKKTPGSELTTSQGESAVNVTKRMGHWEGGENPGM